MPWRTSDYDNVYAADGFLTIYAENGATNYGEAWQMLLKEETYTLTFEHTAVTGWHGTGPSNLDVTVWSTSVGSPLASASYSGNGSGTLTFTTDTKVTYIRFGISSTSGTGTKFYVYNVKCVCTVTR